MSTDYKPKQASSKQKTGGGFLIGLFVGFLLGVGAAGGVAIYFVKSPRPFVDKTRSADRAQQPVPNLGDAPKAAKSDEGKPRFDFYRILPGQEEPVTEQQIKQAAKAGAVSKSTYFLQAGSFQNPADADNLKARLALMGLESSVEPANLPEKGVWYRVRLGPYSQLDEINRIRQQLVQNGVEASLVKLSDGSQN